MVTARGATMLEAMHAFGPTHPSIHPPAAFQPGTARSGLASGAIWRLRPLDRVQDAATSIADLAFRRS